MATDMAMRSRVRGRLLCGVAMALLMQIGIANAAPPPSFEGVWEQSEPKGSDLAPMRSPYGEPTLRPPYSASYAETRKRLTAVGAQGRPAAGSASRCIPAGMPQMMMGLPPIEIVEVPGRIVILGRLFGELRHIYLNEKMPPLEELTPTFAGYSVARWDGSTLVVETRGVREDVQFFHIPHSAEMTITERLRLTARGTLEDSIVVSDPAVLAKPYRMKFEYRRAVDQKSAEYVCDESRAKVKDGPEAQGTNPAR